MKRNCFWISYWFAFCTFCLVPSQAAAKKRPAPVKKEVSANPEHLSPKDQARVFEGMKKLGTYFNNPYTWQHIQDPDIVVAQIYAYGEPLDSYQLDALQRVSPQLMESRTYAALQASALLYRYGRPQGETQLSALLADKTHHNFAVAAIFALNQDAHKLDAIVELLNSPPSEEDAGMLAQGLLIDALGKWHDPKVADVLWEAFQHAPEHSDQFHLNKSNYILALAQQENMKRALPELRRLYFGSAPGSSTHADAGAAIVKLDSSKADQIYTELLTEMADKSASPASSNRLAVIIDFGTLHITKSIPSLEAVIQFYLAHPNSAANQNDFDSVTAAAASLAAMDAKGSQSLVTKLLLQLSKSNLADAYKAQTARAVLSLAGKEGIIVVSRIMGKKWLQSELFQRTLRPISDYLVPKNETSN